MPSLYQTYRPQKFADLVGQTPIVITLTQAIARERVGHAYLFSGPKGSGKTTIARLLAKAVNCEQRKKGEREPCNRCRHCRAINAGSDLDILEIDAASHRGIEEIRALRDTVKLSPTKADRKVYIIDEVHMLTREAFNALLKTLEEPPAHAIFILATTEPHKVPATIKSRTQHFLFRRAGLAELTFYLKKVVKAEKINLEDDALKIIVGTAEGSFRDALSTLEQVTAAYPGRKIKAQGVRNLLGLADRELVFDLLTLLAKKESRAAIDLLGELDRRGSDIKAFIQHVLEVLRALLLFLVGSEEQVKASHTAEEIARFQELQSFWGIGEAIRVIESLIAAAQLVRISPLPVLPLEIWAAELTTKGEEGIKGDQRESSFSSTPHIQSNPSGPSAAVPVAKEIERVDENVWKSILSKVREVNASLYSILREAIVLGQTADGIALGVRFRFHAELLSAAKNQSMLTEAVTKVMGKPAQITVELKPEVFTKQEEELLKMAEELL